MRILAFFPPPLHYLALGNELQRTVPDPFFGIVPASQPLGRATTTVAQLLRSFLTFLVSYTNGKLIDDGSPGRLSFFGNVPNFQSSNNRRLE